MAPEYGATCGIFPVDAETLRYLRLTGRPESQVQLVEAYMQGTGHVPHGKRRPAAIYTDTLELDLATVEPSLAGPTRPQDRVPLDDVKKSFRDALADAARSSASRSRSRASPSAAKSRRRSPDDRQSRRAADDAARPACRTSRRDAELQDGSVVIAAITSCTNTSNPSVMVAAGLLAKKAVARGLTIEAVGEDQPGPRLEGRHRLPDRAGLMRTWSSSLLPGRLRLHDLHRQQRPAARRRSRKQIDEQRAGRRSGARAAIATSRAASIPRCGRTTWPRRRWSSPMPWPADRHRLRHRAARHRTATASRSILQGHLADASRKCRP